MPCPCSIAGCKAAVPAELEAQKLCISHFTLEVERKCADMRLETARGTATAERRAVIARFISEQGGLLARVATETLRLPDELKARILSTFLTLMNLRENMERASARQAGTPATESGPSSPKV